MQSDQGNQDVEQLRILSILHYVLAGFLALLSMLPILHIAMGIAIVTGAFDGADPGEPPPAFFGWMFIIIPTVMMLCGLTLATCIAVAGRRLQQNRSYTFCLIIAAIQCVFMPLGTLLGVCTLIVLMRPRSKNASDIWPVESGNLLFPCSRNSR